MTEHNEHDGRDLAEQNIEEPTTVEVADAEALASDVLAEQAEDAPAEATESNETPEVAEAPESTDADTSEEVAETETEAVEAAESSEGAEEATDADESGEVGGEGGKRKRRRKKAAPKADVSAELDKLVELATKYPEIGPALAQLAFKLDRQDIGQRVVRMGLDEETRGVEFYFVATDAARRDGRHDDALTHVVDALTAFRSAPEGADADERQRLLRLVRRGFQVLMFDIEDVASRPGRIVAIRESLEALTEHFAEDHFFHTLLAQAVWFEDRERSEELWEKAVSLGDAESAWNARGTWYKEAESDLSKAESTYRRGLKSASDSSLLRLNLAQALMDRAGAEGVDPDQARGWIREAEGLLRNALRGAPRHLRRHIHENLDRATALGRKLPKKEIAPPEVGQRVHGKIVSLKPYGAFVALEGGHTGLLHKSEMAHEWIEDASHVVKVGDSIEVEIIEVGERDNGGLRIGLSRKPLLPAPEPGSQPARPEGQPSGRDGERKGRGRRGGNRGGGGGGGRGGNRGGGRGGNRGGGRGGNRGGGNRGGGNNRGGNGGGNNQQRRDSGKGKDGEATPGAFTLGDLLLSKLNEKSDSKGD